MKGVGIKDEGGRMKDESLESKDNEERLKARTRNGSLHPSAFILHPSFQSPL
jgi:hypothetical protein